MRYGQRPSEILGVDDPWLAYQVDLAAMAASLRYGGTPDQPSGTVFGKIVQLAKRGIRKMKIPESGVW
jgi:hypothetical protein